MRSLIGIVLAVGVLSALAACTDDGTDRAEATGTEPAGTTSAPTGDDPPVEVDGRLVDLTVAPDGTRWAAVDGPDGTHSIHAWNEAETHDTVEVPGGSEDRWLGSLIVVGDRVLLAHVVCETATCADLEVVVAALAVTDGAVTVDERWRASKTAAEPSLPMLAGSEDGRLDLVVYGEVLTFDDTDERPIARVQMDPGLGDPCRVDGRLLAVAGSSWTPGQPVAGPSTDPVYDVPPEGPPGDEPLVLVDLETGEAVEGSSFAVGTGTGEVIRCRAGTYEVAASGQPARAIWTSSGWQSRTPGAVAWDEAPALGRTGLAGVIGDEAVLVDPATGDELARAELPDVAREAQSARAEDETPFATTLHVSFEPTSGAVATCIARSGDDGATSVACGG